MEKKARYKTGLAVFLVLVSVHFTSAQLKFSSLNELLDYTGRNSLTVKSDSLKLTQAKKARLAAIINILDASTNNSVRFVNNTKLPVSAFPAEIFGGQPGTFTNITTGVQYTTTATQSAEIKLINFPGWENLRLSRINVNLQDSDNKVSLKTLQENIASAYYNVITLQKQAISNKENQAIADTLYRITSEKHRLGQVRQQQVNDARVALVNASESARQSEFLLKNNYLALKILCDIPDTAELVIDDPADAIAALIVPEITLNKLDVANSILNEQYKYSNYRYYQKQFLPTLSAEVSQSWQLFNTDFSVFNGDWINSRYFGFKVSLPLPTATQIANATKARYDYRIAQKRTEQAKIKAGLQHAQLKNDFEKSTSQYLNNKEILALRRDSYSRNMNLYREGLIALDEVLDSYNTMINADYTLISSVTDLLLIRSKIEINNKLQ